MLKSYARAPCLAVVAALVTTAPIAWADTAYPQRAISFVVPFAPGGTSDIVARVLADKAGAALGQPVVVENRGGAGGNLGVSQVSRAAADGYTIVLCAYSCAVAPSLYKPAPYRIDQLEPVVMVGTVPSVLVVNPKVPAGSIQEFIAYAKAHPGKLNAASSGFGSSGHMALELFKREAGVDIVHVPYKGSGQVAADLISGQVDLFFDNLPTSIAYIEAGSLRALAVGGTQRSPAVKAVPTFVESGLPNMVVMPWFGVLAPKGTPPNALTRLNAAFNQALEDPEVRKRMTDQGVDIVGGDAKVLSDFLMTESASLAKLIEENNITPE